MIDREVAGQPELGRRAAATWRWLFDCTTPPETSVSAPCASASFST
jgi:hypothetical protein